MSKLNASVKEILKKYVSIGHLLELFPGSDNDSIEFFHSITHSDVVAIGDENLESSHLEYYKQRVPPYPLHLKKFDYIFLNEAEWLVYVEFGGPVNFGKFPAETIRFIDKNLKKNGRFIISNIHIAVADIIKEWMNQQGYYSFFYENSVAIFTKL